MKALIFGAGKIARGFVAHLLQLSGIEFTFVENNRDLVAALNRQARYHVEVMGNPDRNAEVSAFQALALDDHEKVARAWAEAPLAFTCVGGKNLENLADHLAAIIRLRLNLVPTGSTSNLITCENWKEPADLLRRHITDRLAGTPNAAHRFATEYGISEAVIMRSAVEAGPDQLAADPLWVNVQDFWELPVDRARILGEPVAIKGVNYISGFAGYLERKFYTYNAANGTASYLGRLRGHRAVSDAANDPWIVAALAGVYDETGRALAAKHGISLEQQMAFAASSLRKLQDHNIIDTVERNARDPLRKLGPDDRLVGSARLVESQGIVPRFLAQSIAAAIHYEEPTDPGACELAYIRNSGGAERVLRDICHVAPDEVLGRLVLQACAALRSEKLI